MKNLSPEESVLAVNYRKWYMTVQYTVCLGK